MALLTSPFLHLYWNSRSLCGFFALINSSRTGRGAVYSSILHKVPVNRAAGLVFICKRGTVGRPKKRENEIYSVAFVAFETQRLNFLQSSGNMEKPTYFLFFLPLFSSMSAAIDRKAITLKHGRNNFGKHLLPLRFQCLDSVCGEGGGGETRRCPVSRPARGPLRES